MQSDDTANAFINENATIFSELSRDIWEHPQLGMEETYAVKRQTEALDRAGFSIRSDLGGMSTAFSASWGHGRPVIGVLGEYDALPGLSQTTSPQKDPVEKGAPGHGCGHNHLGVGSMAAVMAAKAAMEKEGTKGTVIYFGCPAEETLVGKVFMAQAGVFDDLDAALSWHPMSVNTIWASASAAMNSFKLNFYGKSAHAGSSPWGGRSALDGVVLTDVGVNYLREHIIPDARIHCVITKGGEAPNIVPDEAQVWYFVRAPRRDQVEEIYDRLLDVAKGAALMSGTQVETEFITGCYDFLSNGVLARVLLEKMRQVGAPQFSEAEKGFADKLLESVDSSFVEGRIQKTGLSREELGFPLSDKVLEGVGGFKKGDVGGGSTDVGDVSYIIPTAQLCASCAPIGVPGHSWQFTAAQGSSIGKKGMLFAAKSLALSITELMRSPDILRAAREEFDQAVGPKGYVSPLPQGLASPSKER
jgi:aminobenzoyl-glutamate utilization protein B